MSKKIVILFPTEVEMAHFINPDPTNVEVVISGVGMCETAAVTADVIVNRDPKLIILAGIGGAYPDGGLRVGDVVVVGSEEVADQGAFRDGEFTSLYRVKYSSELAAKQTMCCVVDGSSVNAAAAEFLPCSEAKVESMEGAAFFAVASRLGTQFMEVRSISNMTNSSRAEWRLEEATKALAEILYKLLDEIKA